jgi:hypothetical protein
MRAVEAPDAEVDYADAEARPVVAGYLDAAVTDRH